MQKTIFYFLLGSTISFLFNHFILYGFGWKADLYHSFSFGLGWALAYFVDMPQWPLTKKIGISFLGILLLWVVGLFWFPLEIVVSSVIRFSTLFVAYYMIASFRDNKSLRNRND